MYKKIIISITTAFIFAFLTTNHLVDAAVNLNQAASTLPSNEEWSIMARAALGSNSGSGYLSSRLDSDTATDYEKRILAITAVGKNPRTTSSEDFIAKLEGFASNGQIGDPSLLNDDIFGILALDSAGVSNKIVSDSRRYLLDHQNSDGGFGFATNTSSDSNTTAMAVAALAATGSVPRSATDYLYRSQASSGGFGFTPGQGADGASTAWVIIGLNSANKKIPSEAKAFLESLQAPNGSFKWKSEDSSGSVLVTAYSIIALSDKGMPIRSVSTTPPPPPPPPVVKPTPQPPPPAPLPPEPSPLTPVRVTISYPDNLIFVGDMNFTNQTALQSLVTAADKINLLYEIQQTGLGQFVKSINGYQPAGTSGWLYAVNGTVPQTPASDYTLNSGDTLQWFYGSSTQAPY